MADFAEALEKLTDVLAPSGLMLPFAGKTIPDGWLLCNGAAVSRTTYADLFAAIGTAWGTGDGSTTFNLPNCDSRFMEGTTDASKVGTYLEAGLPNITGNFYARTDDLYATCIIEGLSGMYSYIKDSVNTLAQFKLIDNGMPSKRVTSDASRVSSIYSNSSTVQPSSVQTLIIIKV